MTVMLTSCRCYLVSLQPCWYHDSHVNIMPVLSCIITAMLVPWHSWYHDTKKQTNNNNNNNSNNTEPGIGTGKQEDISRGVGRMLPRKIWKVETKICANWGILEANLKKSSTLKFIMYIIFVPSVFVHGSTIFILIEKSILVNLFPRKIFFQRFSRESSFPRRIPGSESTATTTATTPSIAQLVKRRKPVTLYESIKSSRLLPMARRRPT